MSVHDIVEKRRTDLTRLCERYQVESLAIFGSAVTGGFDEQTSDLDFLVVFRSGLKPGGLADAYFGLLAALEDLFARPIDLVTAGSIKNPYVLQTIQTNNEPLYAA